MINLQVLYDSVAELGFETSLESDKRFLLAVNRAILQVNRVKPATAIFELSHLPLPNCIQGDTFEPVCKDGDDVIYYADGVKSFYFECNGEGDAYIETSADNGNSWVIIETLSMTSADKSFKSYFGFVKDGDNFVTTPVRLRFSGRYIFYIRNVAFYGSLLSESMDDIPKYSKYISYDLASLVDDFLSFTCPPIVDALRGEGFVLNRDYFVEGASKVLLPASIKGIFDISYNRRVAEVPLDVTEKETVNIELDEELCALLPNLVAGYIWLDDEPAKAEFYLSLYREQVAEIKSQINHLRPVRYRNKNGW